MYVLGIDVSYYQDPAKVPYAEFAKHGFCFVVIKASMGGGYDARCDAHVAAAKAAGWKFGLYHWCDPTQSTARQAQFFVDKIAQHNPDFLWYDIEQYWADWNEFVDQQRGTGKITKFLTPAQIIANGQGVIDRVSAVFAMPSVIYTGKWFIDAYVKQTWPWTITDVCLAQYTNYGGVVTWEYFDKTIIPALRAPSLPQGLNKWWGRQFDSNIKLPSNYINYDLDIFNGTIENFHDWLGYTLENWDHMTPEDKLDGPVLRLLQEHNYVMSDGTIIK